MPDGPAMSTYAGEWELVPELSLYQEGDPPASGIYRIFTRGGAVEIHIDWTLRDGSEHTVAFGGPLDGRSHPSDAPGVDAVSYTAVDERTLDSSAYDAGEEVAYARRIASVDGALLVTLQVGRRGDGSRFRNTQVYRRIRT